MFEFASRYFRRVSGPIGYDILEGDSEISGTFASVKVASARNIRVLKALAKYKPFLTPVVRLHLIATMSPHEEARKDRATELAEQRTDLGVQRTLMAAERSLMAWIRTALSMIGFGFTIFKFFQYLPEDIAAGNIKRPQAPRNLGLTLIALGTIALAAAAWQHWHFRKSLGAPQMQQVRSIAFMVAIFVILIGVITFYGVLLRKGPF